MTPKGGRIETTNFHTVGETGKEFIHFSCDSMPSFVWCDDTSDFVSLPKITKAVRCSYCGVLSEEFDVCPRCGAPK